MLQLEKPSLSQPVSLTHAPQKLGSNPFFLAADSMEEASALATKVGILAKRMLGAIPTAPPIVCVS